MECELKIAKLEGQYERKLLDAAREHDLTVADLRAELEKLKLAVKKANSIG